MNGLVKRDQLCIAESHDEPKFRLAMVKGRTEERARKGKFPEFRKSNSLGSPIMRLRKIGGNGKPTVPE